MEKLLSVKLLAIIIIISFYVNKSDGQTPVNWTSKQLLEPPELATAITANKALPVIISVGPGAVIPHSINAGMASEKEGMDKLKATLKDLPKDSRIVIYCGCCPFEHCPNVRPAIDALKQMQFTNYYLLDIPDNIKKDWIDKGYPVLKTE